MTQGAPSPPPSREIIIVHFVSHHHHHHHHLNDGLPMEVEPTGFNPRILLSGPQIAGAVVIIIVVMIYDNNPQVREKQVGLEAYLEQ